MKTEEEKDLLLELEQGVRGLVVSQVLSGGAANWATAIFVKLDQLRGIGVADSSVEVPGLVRPGSGVMNVFTVGPERRAVVEWALNECHRVNGLPTRVDPSIYWAVAAPGVKLSPKELREKSWCAGFALCAVRSVGFGVTTRWDFFGKGMGASIFPTVHPQPGDIAYFDQPAQHYALIEAVSEDSLWLINGNSSGKGITRNVVKRSKPSACYSIDRMLDDRPRVKGTT